jgi:hypothetical protein
MSPYIKDLLERVVVTFVEAFLAVFVVTDVNSAKAAAVAGAAAVLSLIKGLVAKKAADQNTASLVV